MGGFLRKNIFNIKTAFFLFFILSGIFFTKNPADAQAQSDEEKAHALFMEAKDHFERLEYKEALEKLNRAFDIFPLPIILIKKAECYDKMGEPELALETYRQINIDNPQAKAKINKEIKMLEKIVSMPIDLTVVTNISGTEVKIDNGEKIYSTPFDISLPRGQHKFSFSKPRYKKVTADYTLKGVSPQVYKLNLDPLTGKVILMSSQKDFRDAILRIDEQPLILNEKEINSSKTEEKIMNVGDHSLACMYKGEQPVNKNFTIRADETLLVSCAEAYEKGGTSTWGWVAVGTSVVSAGLGIFWLVSYYDDKDYAEKHNKILDSNKHIFGGIFLGLAVLSGGASYFLFTSSARKGEGDVEVLSNYLPVIIPSERGAFLIQSLRF